MLSSSGVMGGEDGDEDAGDDMGDKGWKRLTR